MHFSTLVTACYCQSMLLHVERTSETSQIRDGNLVETEGRSRKNVVSIFGEGHCRAPRYFYLGLAGFRIVKTGQPEDLELERASGITTPPHAIREGAAFL